MADDVERDAPASAVASYKAMLQDVIDRRPSGTRRRLAMALGKNRSFVTQITNPTYLVPIPAQHLQVIFDICHFSSAERDGFLSAYEAAHPGRAAGRGELGTRVLNIGVPDFGDAARNRAFDTLVMDLIGRLVRHEEGND